MEHKESYGNKIYKPSRYNWYYSDNNIFLILNTIHWKIYELELVTYNLLRNNLYINSNDINNEVLLMTLIKEGLLQEYSVDEINVMEHFVNLAKYDQELKVTIIPTAMCNFRCTYCYQDHESGHMNDEIENRIIKFFEKNIKKYKSINIEWFGGEPLIQRERVIRLSKRIKEIGRINHVPTIGSMTTNGYLLDLNTFEQLVKSNLLYYQITLDGPKEIHDKLRPHISGNGSFETIFNNLLDIKENSTNSHFKIAIRINVCRINSQEIDEFLTYINNIFADDHRFEYIIETVKDWGGESVKEIKEGLFDYRNQLNSIISDKVKSDILLYDEFSESISNRICHSSKVNGFVINYDGIVCKCAKAMYEDIEVQEKNKIGELNINGLINYDEIKNSQWLAFKEIDNECKDCCWLPACITMHCPLTNILKVKPKCFFEDNGEETINKSILNAYKKKKYIVIGG